MKVKKIVRDTPMINGWSALKAIQLNKEKIERKKNRFKRIKKIFKLIVNKHNSKEFQRHKILS